MIFGSLFILRKINFHFPTHNLPTQSALFFSYPLINNKICIWLSGTDDYTQLRTTNNAVKVRKRCMCRTSVPLLNLFW